MGQLAKQRRLNANRVMLEVANTSVTVAQAGNTTLLALDTREIDRLYVQVDVTGQALDAFLIKAAPHPDASVQTLYSAAADFTAPAGLLVGTSGDLTTIAASASGWFVMDVRGVAKVEVLASSGNVAGSTVSAYAGGR